MFQTSQKVEKRQEGEKLLEIPSYSDFLPGFEDFFESYFIIFDILTRNLALIKCGQIFDKFSIKNVMFDSTGSAHD